MHDESVDEPVRPVKGDPPVQRSLGDKVDRYGAYVFAAIALCVLAYMLFKKVLLQ
ncbi:MAG: hypothetical protein AB1640_23200 [bacterium]